MRPYTSPSQKVNIYSEKYNLSTEEVKRILNTDDTQLCLEELKIKYDNPDIDKLPKWLTEVELENIIWCSIYKYYKSSPFEQDAMIYSQNDLFNDVYLQIRYKLAQIPNFKYLKVSVINTINNILHTRHLHSSYFPKSLDDDITAQKVKCNKILGENDYRFTYAECMSIKDNPQKLFNLIESLNSISNKQIRDTIIMVGYLVCEIDDFKDLYEKIKTNQDLQTQKELDILENRAIKRDDIIRKKKYDNYDFNGRRPTVKHINLADIVSLMNLEEGYEDIISLKQRRAMLWNDIVDYLKHNKVFE